MENKYKQHSSSRSQQSQNGLHQVLLGKTNNTCFCHHQNKHGVFLKKVSNLKPEFRTADVIIFYRQFRG